MHVKCLFFHRLEVPLKIGVDLTGYSLQCKLLKSLYELVFTTNLLDI